MGKNGWMLAIGAGVILLAAAALTVGRGWIGRAPAAGDTNILAGGGGSAPAMDENALVAANAERPLSRAAAAGAAAGE